MISTLMTQNSETVEAEYEIIERTEEKKKKLVDEIVAKLRMLNGYRDQAANASCIQEWQPDRIQS